MSVSGAATILAERLAGKRLLVVLDNCEHLIAAVAALVDRVLRRARRGGGAGHQPGAAGGGRGSGVADTALGRAPPPASQASRSERLSQFDGVRLFVDRARRVRPNFHLSDDNGPVVAGICEHLDGIPLAIELAAARCRSLSPAQILDGLADAFRLADRRRPRRFGPPADPGSVDRLEPQPARPDRAGAAAPPVGVPGWLHPRRRRSRRRRRSPPAPSRSSTSWTASSPSPWSQLDDNDPSDVRYRLLETVRQYGARQLDAAGETGHVP